MPEMTPALDLAQRLVRVPSLTPLTPDLLPAAKASLDVLEVHARASGAQTWRLPAEGGHAKWGYAVDNLYVEWVKGQPERSVCFMGHTDVVPVGDEAAWTVEPFGGELRDGVLYGRGTTDMKGAVAAFFAAVADALDGLENVRIGAIITTDEEWAAVNGSRHVLAWLAEQGKGFDAFLVGEPSSVDVFGTHLKVGRRGSLVGRLIAEGVQGHAAYPEGFVNPNRALALAVSVLQTLEWDDATPHMPASRFEPVAIRSGDFAASAVIPAGAEALWNIRFTPAQTPEALVARLEECLANPPAWALAHPDVGLLSRVKVVGNLDTASLPYLSAPGRLTEAAVEAVREVAGRLPALDCSGGTTDGRFVHAVFADAEVLEVGVPSGGGLQGDVSRGGMHQIDECVAASDVNQLCAVYKMCLRRYFAA